MVRNRPKQHPQAPGGPHREPNLAHEDAATSSVDLAGQSSDESASIAQDMQDEEHARELALLDTCDVELNRRDIYGDGDQSFIRDEGKRKQFRDVNGVFFDLRQDLDSVSTFWMACFTGNFEYMANRIHEVKGSPTKLKQLLERRETKLRAPPLIAATYAASIALSDPPTRERVKTARILIASGANVNAKDVAGCTALAHCLNGRVTTVALLQAALKIGAHDVPGRERADPNLENRFGDTPLVAAVMSDHVGCVTVLMELGAGCCASKDIRELLTAPLWKEGGCVGRKVVFVGIEGASSCLNGKIGTVIKLDPEKAKYEVNVDADGSAAPRTVSIPPRRLELAHVFVGKKIKLVDLVGRRDLNSRVGDGVRFLAKRGRYEVQLARDGATTNEYESITVKPANIRRLESGVRAAMMCSGCGKAPGKDTKLKHCKGYCVSYCGKACSTTAWKKHKPACKARAANQVRVDMEKLQREFEGGKVVGMPADIAASMMNLQIGQGTETSKQETSDSKVSSSQFVVKVQISGDDNPLHGAVVYDQTKQTQIIIPKTMSEEYDKIHKAVETLGVAATGYGKGVKAYFIARYLDGGKIVMIDCGEPVTPPGW